jgi:hypothetical protein
MVRADEKIVATGYTAPWGCRRMGLPRLRAHPTVCGPAGILALNRLYDLTPPVADNARHSGKRGESRNEKEETESRGEQPAVEMQEALVQADYAGSSIVPEKSNVVSRSIAVPVAADRCAASIISRV